MKAVTTITLTKEIPKDQIEAAKNLIDNDPQQIEDAVKFMKQEVTKLFAINGEEVDVTFKYEEWVYE